ncbi:hypothetical protein H5410_016856 [Solanum commersonii]|uniref:DUF4283 domain-containing protein n=1 Tax=Solanum commersonii TaxID=4109 RepID=A0A9J5ZXR8_SOLCO|nr:hypothetical protein H5410_016856 [Solanum commersonii]
MFNPEEETTTSIAWIFFPSLPPNFFGHGTIFSLAVVVGKPLQVDMATRNRTRPNCARVKVEAYKEIRMRVNLWSKDTKNGEEEEINNKKRCGASKACDLSPSHTNSLKMGQGKANKQYIYRSVNTQKSFERLMDLNKRNHYAFIALIEQFQDPSEIDQYKRKLGFDNAGAEWEVNIILDTVQQVTIKFRIKNKYYIISVVYARCNTLERLELWDELEGIIDRELCPWVIGGDFNVILNEEEKLGGLPFTQNEAIDKDLTMHPCI